MYGRMMRACVCVECGCMDVCKDVGGSATHLPCSASQVIAHNLWMPSDKRVYKNALKVGRIMAPSYCCRPTDVPSHPLRRIAASLPA